MIYVTCVNSTRNLWLGLALEYFFISWQIEKGMNRYAVWKFKKVKLKKKGRKHNYFSYLFILFKYLKNPFFLSVISNFQWRFVAAW